MGGLTTFSTFSSEVLGLIGDREYLHGGSAVRAIAGFGRHGVLHEDHFFVLAADLPVEIGFAVTDEEAERFLQLIRDEKVSIFYLRLPVEFDVINGELPHVPQT